MTRWGECFLLSQGCKELSSNELSSPSSPHFCKVELNFSQISILKKWTMNWKFMKFKGENELELEQSSSYNPVNLANLLRVCQKSATPRGGWISSMLYVCLWAISSQLLGPSKLIFSGYVGLICGSALFRFQQDMLRNKKLLLVGPFCNIKKKWEFPPSPCPSSQLLGPSSLIFLEYVQVIYGSAQIQYEWDMFRKTFLCGSFL